MEALKATQFIDDVINDFKTSCDFGEYYKHDTCLILSPYEMDELHRALTDWVEKNNIVQVQTVAHINNEIKRFLEDTRNEA